MSKRVYEIARELDLSTKEVIDRLNNSGIEVKSHLAVVKDPVYERVFTDGSDGVAPNGRSEVREAEALPSMIQSPRKHLLSRRPLAYILVAALAFAVGIGVGATTAFIIQSELSFPARDELGPASEQGDTPEHPRAGADRSQQKQAGAKQEEVAASQQAEAEYVSRVGEIQANSVETFLDSHNKLLRYDALTADEVEEMQINQMVLPVFATQVGDLNPPQKYREQYEVFRLAINELYEATQLAYTLVADPTAATQAGFDEYDRHVNAAATGLQRSNEILGRDYKTIEGVQRASPWS